MYVHCSKPLLIYFHSSQWSSHYIINTTSIVTSSREILWFELTPVARGLSFSLTLAWHDNFATPQLIYTYHTPRITWSLVLFHSHLSMVSKDMPNHDAMTWTPGVSRLYHSFLSTRWLALEWPFWPGGSPPEEIIHHIRRAMRRPTRSLP